MALPHVSRLFIHRGKIRVVSSHVVVGHNILFDPIADRFILVDICGSHKGRSGICENEGIMNVCLYQMPEMNSF